MTHIRTDCNTARAEKQAWPKAALACIAEAGWLGQKTYIIIVFAIQEPKNFSGLAADTFDVILPR